MLPIHPTKFLLSTLVSSLSYRYPLPSILLYFLSFLPSLITTVDPSSDIFHHYSTLKSYFVSTFCTLSHLKNSSYKVFCVRLTGVFIFFPKFHLIRLFCSIFTYHSEVIFLLAPTTLHGNRTPFFK